MPVCNLSWDAATSAPPGGALPPRDHDVAVAGCAPRSWSCQAPGPRGTLITAVETWSRPGCR